MAAPVRRDEALELQHEMIALVRAFGFHRGDVTPCGHPLSVSEAYALVEIASAAPISQKDLAGRLVLDKSTVSRLVATLERRGWVEKSRSGGDGRVSLLAPTPDGSAAAGRIGAARRQRFRALIDAIPAGRRREVLEAVRILVQASRASS